MVNGEYFNGEYFNGEWEYSPFTIKIFTITNKVIRGVTDLETL